MACGQCTRQSVCSLRNVKSGVQPGTLFSSSLSKVLYFISVDDNFLEKKAMGTQ